MAKVSFNKIKKIFGDGTKALNDFNLEVNAGEFVVLVGPSGCGKSTLLRILAGLETATTGEVCIGGENVNRKTPQQRNVAMVFQNYALYPHMTVRGNLAFPLKMMRLPRKEIERRLRQVSDQLGLGDLLDRKPKQLSGGQRQRVAMGRAIVRQPSVFLMDEPLSNLDAKLRVQIRTEIALMQRRLKTTMLYVTHDQVEAMTLGDRVAVVNKGLLQQIAEPRVLYEHPANVFVAGFIGNPGMNVFAAELIESKDGYPGFMWGEQFVAISQSIPGPGMLRKHVGKEMYVGMRPEGFCHPDSPVADIRVPVEVESVEALGYESLLYFRSEMASLDIDCFAETGQERVQPQMVARLSGLSDIGSGQQIELGLDPKQLYLFSKEGEALR